MNQPKKTGQDKWQRLEAALAGPFGRANALAGGHELSFKKALNGEKLVVNVYVDGWIKGEWTRAENDQPAHPEGQFWRPMSRRLWKPKDHGNLKRAFGKKRADEMTRLRVYCFSPSWNSPRSLVRHLKKHFPDLELLEPGDHSER